MGAIKLISGGFLVLVGFAIATGQLQRLSNEFTTGSLGDFSYRIEECTTGLVSGDVHFGQYGSCVSGDEDVETIKARNRGEDVSDGSEAGSASLVDNPVDTAIDTGGVSSIESAVEAIDVPIGLRNGNRAPNFTTTTLDGEVVSLADFRGKVVLLNFWFTNCGPCRVEMPEFQNVTEAYADEDVVIVAVNREEGPEPIREFADELGLTFPILLDEEGDIQFQYDVKGYPSTFILDRDGVIQFRTFSAMTVEQIQELVQEALAS